MSFFMQISIRCKKCVVLIIMLINNNVILITNVESFLNYDN